MIKNFLNRLYKSKKMLYTKTNKKLKNRSDEDGKIIMVVANFRYNLIFFAINSG